jgi:hypothetical protein
LGAGIADVAEIDTGLDQAKAGRRAFRLGIFSFLGALIEGGCALLMLTSAGKVVLGLGSTVFAETPRFFHVDYVRWPVMIASALGASVVLYIVWHQRQLRNAPAARWRKRPLSKREKWRIRVSVASAILSWVLVIGEYFAHPIVIQHH